MFIKDNQLQEPAKINSLVSFRTQLILLKVVLMKLGVILSKLIIFP